MLQVQPGRILIEEVTNLLDINKVFFARNNSSVVTSSYVSQIEHNQDRSCYYYIVEAENPLAHEPESDNKCKLCEMYNIPFGHNLATAECLLNLLREAEMGMAVKNIYQVE